MRADLSAKEIASALGQYKQHGDQYVVRCPSHNDNDPSLWLCDKNGKVLLHCMAGCQQDEVMQALTARGLWSKEREGERYPNLPQGIPYFWPPAALLRKQGKALGPENQKTLTRLHRYVGPESDVLGFVVRYDGHGKKDIIPFFKHWDQGGAWRSGHAASEGRYLYGLNLLAKTPEHHPVLVVEGEKCADAVNGISCALSFEVVAVTWPGGSKVASKADWTPLHNRSVILWPDNDLAGYRAMMTVWEELSRIQGVEISVVDVEASGCLEAGSDVADLLLQRPALLLSDLRIVPPGDTEAWLKARAAGRRRENQAPPDQDDQPGQERPPGEPPAAPEVFRVPGSGRRNLPHTDLGNAKRFELDHAKNVRHTSAAGWFFWNETIWVPDDDSTVFTWAVQTAEAIADEATGLPPPAAKPIIKWAKDSQNASRLNAMLSVASHSPGMKLDYNDFDSDPWHLNCQNGTLNLKTGKLEKPSRDHYMTQTVGAKYDPDAECPTWLEFLKTVMQGEQTLVEYLQRCVGYTLTGSVKEQVLFMLWGDGQNGKGVFLQTLQDLFGSYAKNTTTNLIAKQKHEPEPQSNLVARLKSARAVIGAEIPEDARLNEAKVKEMTGGDMLTARFLYKENFDFKPQFKLWFSMNAKPVVSGVDFGIWRRIRLIPFTLQIPVDQQDKELKEKLRKEFPGILAWAVRGCLDWQRGGLQTPLAVQENVEDYRKEMDGIGEWLEDFCIVERTAECAATVLYASYAAWAKAQGAHVNSARWLGLELKKRKFHRVRRQDARYYQGIRLKANVTDTGDVLHYQDEIPF